MKITAREVMISIVVAIVWICIGILIHGKITSWEQDKNAEYDKAAQITDQALFRHGMDTNLGNAFVYGELKTRVPVSYPEIPGQYMYVKKVEEHYTMHTRTVTYTTGSGKSRQTHTRVETYWTWDRVGEESKITDHVVFCGEEFETCKIELPSPEYIDTQEISSYVRFVYSGVPECMNGTVYTELKDKTITDGSRFYEGLTIEEVIEDLETGWQVIVFWVVWIVLLFGILYGFVYMENEWLE